MGKDQKNRLHDDVWSGEHTFHLSFPKLVSIAWDRKSLSYQGFWEVETLGIHVLQEVVKTMNKNWSKTCEAINQENSSLELRDGLR